MDNYKSTLTRPVGDRLLVYGHLLKVQVSDNCKECFFSARNCHVQKFIDNAGFCSRQYRTDGLSVIFKEVQQ